MKQRFEYQIWQGWYYIRDLNMGSAQAVVSPTLYTLTLYTLTLQMPEGFRFHLHPEFMCPVPYDPQPCTSPPHTC